MFPHTKLEYAQAFASLAVHVCVSRLTGNLLATNTTISPNKIPGMMITGGTAMLVTGTVKPYTDKAVEKTANKITELRTKKDKPEEE